MEVALEYKTITRDDKSSSESDVDSDVEDTVEVGLIKASKLPRHHYAGATVSGLTKAENGVGEPSENSTYLDKYGGAIEDLDIGNVLNSVRYDASNNRGAETAINSSKGVITEAESETEEEIMEEEVVELEFEKAIPKLQTHTMHCPNCDHHITKVVLRRKIIKRKPQITEQPHKPLDLFGCFSCFSLFTSTDNRSFSPFPIFGSKPSSSAGPRADGSGVVREDGNCFSIFRVFRRETDSEVPNQRKVDKDSKQSKPGKLNRDYEKPKPELDRPSPIQRGDQKGVPSVGTPSEPEKQPLLDSSPSHPDRLQDNPDLKIDILLPTSPRTTVPPQRQDSTSFEILKSIVYGGLMEVIASLSIVASAAAGDATTLNIIALALANLIGGVFVIGHNLWDLKDDCYKYSTQPTSNEVSRNKYKELLGSVEHFPLHAFFAILSFLVFGIIPPVAYGYSFHETNDRDLTMLIVAIASFICVGLLAIFKAYIDRCTGFSGYVKTIMYYLTTAVTVSGVSYAAGNLVKRLIEEFGLFETSSTVGVMVVPKVASTNPSLAYY